MAAVVGVDGGLLSLARLMLPSEHANTVNADAQVTQASTWRRIEPAGVGAWQTMLPARPSILCVSANPNNLALFRAMVPGDLAANICAMDGAVHLLERVAIPHAPSVLLVDIELCAGLDAQAWLRLCGSHSALRVLLVWPAPARHWIPTILLTRASGCVDWSVRPEELRRAIAAVQSGELWIPRQVMGWVFAALLADTRPRPPVAAEPDGAGLTPREAEVLQWLRQGLSNKQIAARMGISINTVKKHVAHAFEKRGVVTRRQECC